MRFFKDLSVRAKLFAGFGVVLAFSVVLAVVLLIQMGNVNSGGVYIATNSLPSVEVINQIRADEAKYRADQLWNITNTDVALSQAPISALNAANAQIQSGFHRRARLLGRGLDRHPRPGGEVRADRPDRRDDHRDRGADQPARAERRDRGGARG
jgi:hypothetical protein